MNNGLTGFLAGIYGERLAFFAAGGIFLSAGGVI
jgi:hypothetical protein